MKLKHRNNFIYNMNNKPDTVDLNESPKDSLYISSAHESPISAGLINEFEESKEIEFFDLRSHKIRISKKNRIMKRQLSLESQESSYITFFSQENFEKLVNTQLESQKPTQNLKLEPGSCFLWYILPKSAFKYVVSDFEMKKCKKVFKNVIQRLSTCHEAHFGLGKLLAHQGILTRAQKHLKIALKLCPSDKLYTI